MAPSLTGGVRPRLAPGPGACTGHVRPPSVLSSSCEDGQPITQPPPPPPLDGQWPRARWVTPKAAGSFVGSARVCRSVQESFVVYTAFRSPDESRGLPENADQSLRTSTSDMTFLSPGALAHSWGASGPAPICGHCQGLQSRPTWGRLTGGKSRHGRGHRADARRHGRNAGLAGEGHPGGEVADEGRAFAFAGAAKGVKATVGHRRETRVIPARFGVPAGPTAGRLSLH